MRNLSLIKTLLLCLLPVTALVACKSGGKGNWTPEDKDAFLDSCLTQSEPVFAFYRDVMGIEVDTKSYCNCFLSKAEAQFESRTGAESARGPEIQKMVEGCKDALVPPGTTPAPQPEAKADTAASVTKTNSSTGKL